MFSAVDFFDFLSGYRNVHFANNVYLLLLPFCVLPVLIDRLRLRNRGIPIGSLRYMIGPQKMMSQSMLSKFGLAARCLCLMLCVLAIARPQIHDDSNRETRNGIDVVLALDTSGSMRARDFEINGERPDRLEVIKSVIANFIEARSDDRIGMVVFGNEAFTQSPLTLDHIVLQKFLESVSIGMAGDGTAIGDGLATAVKRLKDSQGKSKVIVLLTDGANNAGRIDPMAAAAAAKSFDIRVHTIGVGSEGIVPIVQNGRVFHIKADIDEKSLKAIADATGGLYRRASDTDALVNVYAEIDKLEKNRLTGPERSRGRDLFQYLVAMILVILAAEILWRGTGYRRLPA